MNFATAFALVFNLLFIKAQAQAPGPLNTNNKCEISDQLAQNDEEGATFYYAATDLDDVGIYVKSLGTCDAGSYARVSITTPEGTDACGYVALDGNNNLVSCPNLPRGTVDSNYQFEIDYNFDPVVEFLFYGTFAVTHVQQTNFAPTPTSTVTTTNSMHDLPISTSKDRNQAANMVAI